MSRYILAETLISIAVNAAISAGFAFVVFGGRTGIGLWGPDGLALDFAPQTFMIALMSVLVPTALTRRRIRTGAIQKRRGRASYLPRNLLVRALLVASLATVSLGGAAMLVLAATWSGALGFATVLPLKIIYGALVALLVTPPALRAAFCDEGT
jgi:lysylphosphatidylglycerol synthetase-like protein (DUF2156 family)